MALVGPYKFRGLDLPAAFVRLAYHGVQVFKNEKRIHVILDMFASKDAFLAGEAALVDRFLEVSVVFDKPKNARDSHDSPGGGKNVTLHNPDVVAAWGGTPSVDVGNNALAQGYNLVMSLPDLAGFKSDQ